MQYSIEIKPQAIKDGKKIPPKQLGRIFDKIELLGDNLQGDVKHLTSFSPEYRLRVWDYRVLFEIEQDAVVVYRIKHRKDVYK
jgi:mRNA interferase RelE/StbE